MKRRKEEETDSSDQWSFIHSSEFSSTTGKHVKLTNIYRDGANKICRKDETESSCLKIILYDFCKTNPMENNDMLKSLQLKLKMKFQNQVKGFVKWFRAKEAFMAKDLHRTIPIEFLDCQEVVLHLLENISVLDEVKYFPNNHFPSWVLNCVEEHEMDSRWKHCKAAIMRAIAFKVVNVFNFATRSVLMGFKQDLVYFLLQYNCCPYEFRDDEEIMLEIVQRNGWFLEYASLALKHNKRVVLAAVKQRGCTLIHASHTLRDDREVVLNAIQQDGYALSFASPSILNHDLDIILMAVQQYGSALKFVPEKFRRMKQVVFHAVQSEGTALAHAYIDLQNDYDIVLAAVKQNGFALRWASTNMKNNYEIVSAAVQTNSEALNYASRTLQDNFEIVEKAVSAFGTSLEFASSSLRSNLSLCLTAVKQDGYSLRSVDRFRNNFEVVLNAVKQNGMALQMASPELQNNFEIVLTAVRQRGAALCFASPALCDNVEIVKEAVKTYGKAIHYASSRLRGDRDVILAALQQDGDAFDYIDLQLQHDEHIYIQAIRNSGHLQNKTILQSMDRTSFNVLKQARLEHEYHDCHIPLGHLISTPIQLCKQETTLTDEYSEEMWWS
ncbi:hypothetical protein C9374_005612 [Naegleria lovaniensis]|uniref:DUF4116 domain-containing protein n=1 Tax=Naegleria lovaniensis TaxID=51637 RepID=A0AA88GQU8_NAELO|nr:uncharacterized protein C9374_005612 [Naegleria lovaniensis]KAG2382410.1 hypothetical protein C9374_005612 [Naegleria lovaniensis]